MGDSFPLSISQYHKKKKPNPEEIEFASSGL